MNGCKWVGIGALILAAGIVGCNVLDIGARWAGDAKEAVYQEVAPKELIRKYRLLKRQAAALDEKQANIMVMEAGVKALELRYKGVPPEKWPRDVNESFDQRATELAGTKAVYNSLAAEYNAEMVDLGYKFCNVGEMPRGMPDDCQTLLKRNYATYRVD